MATGLPARVVFVCTVLATAGTAVAERRPVAVIDLSATTPARDLANALYRVLRNHVDLLPLDNVSFITALQDDLKDEEEPYLQRARRAKQEAEEHLAQLDDVNAERAARRGMEELSHVLPSSEVLGLYADLAFAHGQAQLGLRRPNDASLAFQLAHRLDAKRRPDPTRYPPNIVEAYEAAASKSSVKAKLEVKGDGRVWIDGVQLGPPGTYDTTEGLHLVQLSGPERETRGELVHVPNTTSTTIAPAPATEVLKIRRARIALAKAPDAAARASAMKRLAKLLGVGDAVLILKDEVGPLLVQTWRDPSPGFSAVVRYRDQKPIDLLSPLAPPREQKPPEGPIIVIPPPIERIPWHRRTWVRASVAGTIALGIVGAVLYATREKFMGSPNPDVQWLETQ